MLNYQTIGDTALATSPYPYMVIRNAIDLNKLPAVMRDFPAIDHPGSIPLDAVSGGPGFYQLIEELQGSKFRQLIEQKFAMNIGDRPTLLTLRGQMRNKDGRIHTDSKTKLITVLLYLNENWEGQEGHLRILNNGDDIENFVEEIPPLAGTMVIFKVTDNCWHGHKPVVGKRLSIQLNYLTSAAAHEKHQLFHGLSAKLKKMFSPKAYAD